MYATATDRHSSPAVHVHPVRLEAHPHDNPLCPGCATSPSTSDNDFVSAVSACIDSAQHLQPAHRPVLPPLDDHLTCAPSDTWVHWSDLTAQICSPQTTAYTGRGIGVVDLPESQAQPAVLPDAHMHVSICGAARTGRSSAARVIAACLDATRENTWWVTADHEHAARIIHPGKIDEVAALMDDLMADVTPRLLVVDGWEALHENLLLLNHGMAADDFMTLITRAHRSGLQIIMTGGRTLMSSKLSALFEMRFILRHNDIGEYSLAGLRPTAIPQAMPPGRALVLPYGRVMQFVQGTEV